MCHDVRRGSYHCEVKIINGIEHFWDVPTGRWWETGNGKECEVCNELKRNLKNDGTAVQA